jgi:hypothetical protein
MMMMMMIISIIIIIRNKVGSRWADTYILRDAYPDFCILEDLHAVREFRID